MSNFYSSTYSLVRENVFLPLIVTLSISNPGTCLQLVCIKVMILLKSFHIYFWLTAVTLGQTCLCKYDLGMKPAFNWPEAERPTPEFAFPPSGIQTELGPISAAHPRNAPKEQKEPRKSLLEVHFQIIKFFFCTEHHICSTSRSSFILEKSGPCRILFSWTERYHCSSRNTRRAWKQVLALCSSTAAESLMQRNRRFNCRTASVCMCWKTIYDFTIFLTSYCTTYYIIKLKLFNLRP